MADAGAVRTESPEQNMQEFAETAMKEMLSWYGYERRDSPPPERCQHRESPPPPPPERSAASLSAAPRLSRPTSPGTDGSVSPRPVSPVTAALANDGGCKRTPVVCSWCNKLGAQLYTMGSKAFCSEPCFSQSRVANFRKTKLCDWCKNIRDSLNIEFINGDQQLQFCSESCLNAYKMNIFCKETEAHIQMLPQLRELVSRPSKDPLITPEMWLRDRPQGGATVGAGETAPLAADEGGVPTPTDRRRLRRVRPDPQRPPLRGVRARSHTMPVLELRERARRRPSAPSRQPPPPPPPPPAASMAAAATVGQPPSAAAVAPGPAVPAPPPPLWQRYHLLRTGAPAGSAPPPPPPLPAALPPGLPPVTVLLPVPVAVPVPVPLPIPVPEDFCRELLARAQCREQPPAPPQPAAPADCPLLKRELEKGSASGSDAEGLDLTVRKRKTDHPRKIKMEEDDFD